MKRFHWKDCTNSSLQGEVEIMSVLAAELVSRSLRSLLLSILLDLGSRGIVGFQANWNLSEAWPMSSVQACKDQGTPVCSAHPAAEWVPTATPVQVLLRSPE